MTVGIINHGQYFLKVTYLTLKKTAISVSETSDDVTAKRILMFNGSNLMMTKMIVNDNDKVS